MIGIVICFVSIQLFTFFWVPQTYKQIHEESLNSLAKAHFDVIMEKGQLVKYHIIIEFLLNAQQSHVHDSIRNCKAALISMSRIGRCIIIDLQCKDNSPWCTVVIPAYQLGKFSMDIIG